MWSIKNHVHNTTGFWGVPDANHAFCEPHYKVSPYVAEFFNSTSSLIFVVVALALRYPKDTLIQDAQSWLAAIGIGSMLFHATMRYSSQLLDEIPMVGFMTTLLVSKLTAPHPWFADSPARKNVAVGVAVLYGLALCLFYIVSGKYEIFVHGFGLVVLVDVVVGCNMKLHAKHRNAHLRARFGSILAILLGKVAWICEHQFCTDYPVVWPLHIAWHGLACWSAHYGIMFAYLARAKEDADLPQWRFFGESSPRTDTDKKKVA